MSLKTYPIELPESAFSALRKPPAEFVQEMKYAAVVKWYEAGMISQDKAAEIAGLSRYDSTARSCSLTNKNWTEGKFWASSSDEDSR